MKCMRCGKDTSGDQVFCPECLDVMQQYPVSPNATVRLPRRPDPGAERRPVRRRVPSEEEQLRVLRKRVRVMTWLLAGALALIIALSIPAVLHLLEENPAFLPGQDYSSAQNVS